MQRQPAEVWPVGKFIQDELDARGWSRLRLAHRMSGARDTNLATIDLLIFAPTPGLLLGVGAGDGDRGGDISQRERGRRPQRLGHARLERPLFGHSPDLRGLRDRAHRREGAAPS